MDVTEPGAHPCPACASAAHPCPACAPLVAELARLSWELAAVDQRRRAIADRHTALSARLAADRAARARPAPPPPTPTPTPERPVPPGSAPAWPSGATAPGAPPPDPGSPEPAPAPVRTLSRHAVQNVLLLLGGALLAVAAVVFTVVSWGNLGVRAGILIGATVLAAGAAWPLARRRLEATAETIAFIGLALVPLDAIAVGNALHRHQQELHQVRPGVTSAGSAALWAAGLALLAIAWAVYGRTAPLRLPRPAAVALAQLPLPLAAIAAGPTPTGLGAALIATAGLDLALVTARPVARRLNRAERAVALATGLVAAPMGTALAFMFALEADTAAAASRAAAALAAATALALVTAWRTRVRTEPEVPHVLSWPAREWVAQFAGLIGAFAAIGALAAPGATWLALPSAPLAPPRAYAWATLMFPLAVAVVLAAGVALPRRLRLGAVAAGLGVLAVLAVRALPYAVGAAAHPWVLLFDPGPALVAGAGQALGRPVTWWYPGTAGMAAALAVVTAVAAAVATRTVSRRLAVAAVHPARLRAIARPVTLVAGTLTGLLVAPTTDLPFPLAVAALLAVPAVLGAVAARTHDPRLAGLAAGLAAYAGTLALVWAHGSTPAYAAATGALVVICAVVAVRAPTAVGRAAGGAGAVLAAGLLTLTGWATPGDPDVAPYARYAPLAVTAVALWITWPARGRPGGRGRWGALAPGAALRARRPGQALAITASGLVVAVLAAPRALWGSFAFVPYGRALMHPHPGRGLAVGLVLAALLTAAAAASATRGPRAPHWWRTTTVYATYALALAAPPVLGRGFSAALTGPYLWVAHSWTGAPGSARAALSPSAAWAVEPLLVPVLAVAAAAVVIAAAAHRGRWAGFGVARVVVPIVLAPLPLAVDVSYAVAVGFLVALTAALALWAAVSRGPAGGATLWVGSLTAGWALAERPATFLVLGVFALVGVVCAVRGRGTPMAATSAAITALAVGAEGAAIALGSGLPRWDAAVVVLAVAVLTSRATVHLGVHVAGRTEPPTGAHPAPPSSGADGQGGTPAAARGAVPGGMWPVLGLACAAFGLWVIAAAMAVPSEQALLVCAAGGAAAVATGRLVPRRLRGVLVAGVLAVEAVALVPYAAALVNTAFGPYHLLATGWRGLPRSIVDHVLLPWPDWGYPGGLTMPVLAIGVGALVAAVRMVRPRGAYALASVAVPVALTALPYALNLPYLAAPAIMGAVAVALAAQAARDPRDGLVPGATGVWAATLTVALAIVTVPSLLIALGGFAVLGAVLTRYARTAAVRAGAAGMAALACGGLAVAGPLAAGVPPAVTGFAVLVAAALAAFAAAEARHRDRAVAVVIEGAGYVIGTVGTALACTDGRFAALGLTAAAGVACGVALRRDRRLAALGAAALLAHLALWTWLARLQVRTPEAFTLTVTLSGLAAGRMAARRWPDVSSWWAYGPALLVTLLPSLAAAWSGDGLVRPVLLAAAAFAVTIIGAVSRLQGPLLLGGAALLLNAGHELVPAVADLVGNGPRWVPIAVTGLALLFAGATYEHRLRDVRRAYRSIARMR